MRALVLASLVLAICLLGAVDEPATKQLTPAERKELEGKWDAAKGAADRAYRIGEYDKLETASRECLAVARQLYPQQDATLVAASLNNLGFALQTRGRPAEAEPLYRDALEMRKRLHKGEDHPDVALSLNNLAIVLQARGRYAEAEPLYRDALEMRRRLYPDQDTPLVARSLNNLAAVLDSRGRYAEGESLHRDALEMPRSRASSWSDGPTPARS